MLLLSASSTLPVSQSPEPAAITTSPAEDTTAKTSAHLETVPESTSYATLTCLPKYMRAIIKRAYISSRGYFAWNIHLNDPRCKPVITNYNIMFRIPYNGCGTKTEITRAAITYSNTVVGSTFDSFNDRNMNSLLNFACKIYRNDNTGTMPNIKESPYLENQSRQYVVKFSFYDSSSFSHVVKASPYYIDTNQDVFVRATLYCPDPNLMLSTDTCVVSPNRYDFTTTTYDLIRGGCIRDPTYTNYYSLDKKTVQFKFRPRSFPRRPSAIYLQCKMAVCNKYNYFSRCYQGCMTRGKKGTSDDEENIIIIGPIILRRF